MQHSWLTTYEPHHCFCEAKRKGGKKRKKKYANCVTINVVVCVCKCGLPSKLVKCMQACMLLFKYGNCFKHLNKVFCTHMAAEVNSPVLHITLTLYTHKR